LRPASPVAGPQRPLQVSLLSASAAARRLGTRSGVGFLAAPQICAVVAFGTGGRIGRGRNVVLADEPLEHCPREAEAVADVLERGTRGAHLAHLLNAVGGKGLRHDETPLLDPKARGTPLGRSAIRRPRGAACVVLHRKGA